MNDQESWWAGEAGNAYTARNRVDWRARIPFWTDIMKFTGARSVYEVGCGAGWNLSAIQEAADHNVTVRGCDINEKATEQADAAGLVVDWGEFDGTLGFEFDEGHEPPPKYELVFTSGVLIHVASTNLQKFMANIIASSAHYVLAIEYAADTEEMIEYRGEMDRLWKRPYGALYEAMGLTLLHTGDAVGFDRCQYWLMEKP